MSGVNIFGEPLQLNKNLTPQRGPAGVGFRYLDAIGNFDINKKRLANVASPIDHYDAINKEYSDNYMNEIKGVISKFFNFLYYWSDLTEICTQYVKLNKKHFLFQNIFPFRA